MTKSNISISQQFLNFFKIATSKKSEDIEKQQEAMLKIEMLIEQAIKDHDLDKVEILLKRNFTINYEQFLILCRNQSDKNKRFSSEIIDNVLLSKYQNEVKHDIDEKLKQCLCDKVPLVSLNTAYEINIVWGFFSKEKEFIDKNYAIEFRDVAVELINRLPVFNHSTKILVHEHPIENFKLLLNNYIREIEYIYRDYYLKLEKVQRQIELKEFNDTLDDCAIVFNNFDTIKNNIRISLRENIKKLDSFELPQEAKDTVTEITCIANEILPLQLSIKQQLEFDNVYKKRLPQVLEEYMNISPLYREKLKSHDENPDTILMESLVEIKNKINEVFDDIQSSNHNKQKVTRQYLKTI